MRAAALWTILWVAPGPRVEPRDGRSRGTLTPPHLLATLATCVCVCAGVCGGVAHPGDGLDEGDPGEEEVAQVVPRHHRHEQVQYIL